MKKPLFAFVLSLFCLGAVAQETAKPVKILTIGNSFADDATAYLPQFVTAAGKELILFRANIGGCTLERHVKLADAAITNPDDPANRLYLGLFPAPPEPVPPPRPEPVSETPAADPNAPVEPVAPPAPPVRKKYNLQEALEFDRWDYVTIQQLSNLSFHPESFEPYAEKLIGYIKKHAPQAEIVIHQTWAYREDYPGFANGKFTQQEMYQRLTAAYRKLGEKYHLRIIPVGAAFQAARATPRWNYTFPDPNYNYEQPVAGVLPVQTGSLNSGWSIKTNPVDQTTKMSLDFKHANAEGRYLAAAVWYEFFFNDDVSGNSFLPPSILPEDAAALRQIAHETVQTGLK